MKLLNIYLIVLLLFPLVLFGQNNTNTLSIEKALDLGAKNNIRILQGEFQQDRSAANKKRAGEWWIPEINAGASIHNLTGTVLNSDGRFFTDVDRESFGAGIGASVDWNIADGIYNAKSATQENEAMTAHLQSQKNQILLNIVNAFYDFKLAYLTDNAYQNLSLTADSLQDQIHAQIDAGLRLESEGLTAKANASQLKIEALDADLDNKKAAAVLVNLLNLDAANELIPETMEFNIVALNSSNDLNEESEFEHPSIQKANYLKQAAELQLKKTNKELLLPSFQLGVYTGPFGAVFSPNQNTTNINSTLMWKIPLADIFSGGERDWQAASVAIANSNIEHIKTTIKSQIFLAQSQIDIAKRKMTLAKEAKVASKKAYEQAIQRQNLGTARPFEIIQNQSLFINTQVSYLKAVCDYNKAQYFLFIAEGGSL